MKITRLADIDAEAGTQIRVKLNTDTVTAYTEAYKAGKSLPPIDIFVGSASKKRILADGFHRFTAAQQAGLVELPCTLHKGEKKDALRFALSANSTHGLPRTNADKRNAVKIALETFPDLSNRAIAEICAVSAPFVGDHRPADNASAVQAENTNKNDTASAIERAEAREARSAGKKASAEGDNDKGAQNEPTPHCNVKEEPPKPPTKRIGRDGKARSMPKQKTRCDALGYPIPAEILESWDRANEAAAQVSTFRTLSGLAKRASEGHDIAFIEVNLQTVIASLSQCATEWERAVPYAVCSTCQGEKPRESCGLCKGRGYVSQFFWDHCVPEEVKKARQPKA